jgi:hypothetical protein
MADGVSNVPALDTEFAFSARVLVGAPIVVGQGPDGLRRYIPILGGSVSGPLLSGSVIAQGGDSQILRNDGVLLVEARYMIQSDDGVLISVLNRGLRAANPEVMEKLGRGEQVPAGDYYFRTTPSFEAPMGSQYEFLNRFVFVATAEREPDAAVVHFFRIL